MFCEELFRIFIASGLIMKNEEMKLKDDLRVKTIKRIASSTFEEINYSSIDKRFY